MKTTFIYALCEPGTRTVRYIGKADKPSDRFKRHLRESIKALTHLGNWLRLLAARKEKPDMVVLREVPFEQWEIAEERYIRLARGCGIKLVNSTDGGDGVTMTPEIREKIGTKNRGENSGNFGRTPWNKGKTGGVAWNLGKITPLDVREKQSLARKGKKPHNLGKPTPVEVRLRQSESARKRWEAPEARAKASETALRYEKRKMEKGEN